MRWRMLALLFLARVGLGFQFQTLASIGDDLVVAYGISYAQIGTLIGLFMAPGLFLALPAGFSGRHASDRTLSVLGLGALAAGGVMSALASDIWMIGAGRVLAGAGFLFSTLYFTKMVADWFSGREIATAMSCLVMSWPFGIAMGQVGHEWLAQTIDWRAPFYAASIYCAVAALCVMLFYRPATEGAAAPGPVGFGLTGQEWRLILAGGFAWGVYNAGYVACLTYAPLMLEAHGETAFDAAATVSIASWLMILSGTACGYIVDRTGRRNMVLVVCMGGAAGALLLLSVDGAGLASSILFGLVGMAPGGVIMALAGEAMRPERRAVGMGVFLTIYYAVMTVCPPAAGLVFDWTGSAGYPILFAVLLFVAVLPAVHVFNRVKVRAQGLEKRGAIA